MKLAYHNFQGIAPRIAPRLLDTYSQEADNVKLWSGELRPFYGDVTVQSVDAETRTVYNYKNDGANVWLTWTSDVNIAKDPIADDTNNRIVISGATSGLRVTDWSMVGATGSTTIDTTNSLSLAVPSPTNIMSMVVSGTGDATVTESRSYVACCVREWTDGKLDISTPGAPAQTAGGSTFVDVQDGQTVTLSNITIPADAYTDARVRYIYIYRASVGSDGSVAYRYTGQINVVSGTTVYSYIDSLPTLDLGEVLVSMEWDQPVDGLQGVISLNNGVLAAYVGQDVYFSYPFQTHAWPQTYRVTVDDKIMGLGSFGNNVVVCTTANPIIILVSDPAAATVQPIAESIPCISTRSIVSSMAGVLYTSRNGICLVSSTEPGIVTDPYFTRDEFSQLNPESIVACVYDRTYAAFFRNPTRRFGFFFDLDNPQAGITTLSKQVLTCWADPEIEALYLVTPVRAGLTNLIRFDSNKQLRRTFKWRSKIDISMQGLETYSAARVRAQYIGKTGLQLDNIPPYVFIENAINEQLLNTVEINAACNPAQIYDLLFSMNSVTFRYFVDGVLRYERECVNYLPFRLPSGFRGWETELELEAAIPVHYVEIATSMAELA